MPFLTNPQTAIAQTATVIEKNTQQQTKNALSDDKNSSNDSSARLSTSSTTSKIPTVNRPVINQPDTVIQTPSITGSSTAGSSIAPTTPAIQLPSRLPSSTSDSKTSTDKTISPAPTIVPLPADRAATGGFTITPSEPTTTPPLLTAIQPAQCVNPGATVTLTGRFLDDHKKHRAVMDGQSGHFHLDINTFSSTALSITIPANIETFYAGPFALYLENAKEHQPDSNTLADIWLCQTTTDTGRDPNQNNQQTPPTSGVVAAPVRNSSTNATPNNTSVVQNDNNQNTQPVVNNGGTLIGAALPPPPTIPAANAVAEDDDTIEAEQVVIVTANMQEATALTDTMANDYGARVKTRENMENIGMVLNVFRLPAGQSVNELLPVLRQRFTNLWIDSNQRFSLMANDRKRYGQQALHWQPELAQCVSDISIGVIDTDVNLQHPSIQGVAIKTERFIDRGETPADTDHGTAVVALIAGNPNTPEFHGLLPKATIYAAGIFRQRGKEKETTTEWLLKGINWLSAQPVDVINLSLGGNRNIVVELALQKVMAQGKIIVAAAGNNGPKSAPVFPAAQDGVVAVTAIDAKQKRYRKANIGQYIDFAAPGVDIWVANQKGKGHYESGTSYATPMVSATLAAYLSNQQTSSVEIHKQLSTLATDIGPSGKDNEFGWGLMRWPENCKNTLANSDQ